LAPADRGCTEHHTKVRDALISLLTDTVSDSKHPEVLRRVFGPDTKFDKPILNFDNSNLALKSIKSFDKPILNFDNSNLALKSIKSRT
jgi:hypothetical protein